MGGGKERGGERKSGGEGRGEKGRNSVLHGRINSIDHLNERKCEIAVLSPSISTGSS